MATITQIITIACESEQEIDRMVDRCNQEDYAVTIDHFEVNGLTLTLTTIEMPFTLDEE